MNNGSKYIMRDRCKPDMEKKVFHYRLFSNAIAIVLASKQGIYLTSLCLEEIPYNIFNGGVSHK